MLNAENYLLKQLSLLVFCPLEPHLLKGAAGERKTRELNKFIGEF